MKLFVRSTLLIAALIGIAVYGLKAAVNARTPPKVEKRAEPTLSVRTVALPRGEHRPALFLIGKVEARDYATINAPIEADVLNIAVREGEYFSGGQQLLKIDQRELEFTADGQQAQTDELKVQLDSIARNRNADQMRLTEVERQLELAKKDYERNQLLFEKKVLPLKQLEQSEQVLLSRQSEQIAMENQVADYQTQQRRLEAQLAALESQRGQTQLLLERAALRAPFAGRVAKVHTAVGARPGRGAPLMDIFNPSRLRLRVAVAQRYASEVRSGQVRAVVQNDGVALTLSYAGIEPQVEAGNSSIDTFFSLPSGDWVLGAVRDVVIELPVVENVAVAPVDAIYNDRFIYRVDAESRADAVECTRIGLTRNTGAKTEGGAGEGSVRVLVNCPQLTDGDAVIADQLPNLLDGVLLKIIDSTRGE